MQLNFHFYPNPTTVRTYHRRSYPLLSREYPLERVRFLEDGCDAVQLFAVRASRDYAEQRLTDQGKQASTRVPVFPLPDRFATRSTVVRRSDTET
jgi:hypothetical protein